jgi:hypothetical protein
MHKSANWVYIYVNRIYKLYELEYKLSQLNKKKNLHDGFLSDEDELYRIKIKNELQKTAFNLADDFIEVFEGCISTYLSSAAEFNAEHMLNYAVEIEEVVNMLKSAKGKKDLENMVVALNSAIRLVHSYGNIIGTSVTPEHEREHKWDEGVWIFEKGSLDNSATMGFLNALTRGDFTDQWDKEIEKRSNQVNWYKIAQIAWEPSVENNDVYLRLGDEPDASMVPIDNVFIPREEYNKVYMDQVGHYSDLMQYQAEVYPPTGVVRKDLHPNTYESNKSDKFWTPISNSPQYGEPYAYIYDGVHRTLAAQRSGANEIKVIRDLGRNSDWF